MGKLKQKRIVWKLIDVAKTLTHPMPLESNAWYEKYFIQPKQDGQGGILSSILFIYVQ